MLKLIFYTAANAINLYVIYVYYITQITEIIIQWIIIDMILFVKFILLFFILIVWIVQKIYVYCYPQHESHKLINLSKCNYNEESKNKLEEEIKNIEKKIIDLDIIKEEIISKIDSLKRSSEFEIKFFKLLIYTYKYEEKQNNINYNVIQNLKNFKEILGLNKIEMYENIFKEGKKYISFLQKIKQSIGQTNLLKQNYKIINDHNGNIYHLSQLKDRRLISGWADNTLNIYKKDTFELQLSIKVHSSCVRSAIQLNNDKIISCSDDSTMNIIKIIDENKYNLVQKLTEHTHCVRNVIEIIEDELISVSQDKTMKKWEIKNDKFECTKTITFQNAVFECNILKINEKEFVISSYGDKCLKFKCLKFWNSYDYSNIATIKDIKNNWTIRILCMIKEDILCVWGYNSEGFYLINISNHQIVKKNTWPTRNIFYIWILWLTIFMLN